MNNILKAVFLSLGCSISLNANVFFHNTDDEFAKMHNFINSMINDGFFRSSFDEISYPKVNIQELEDKYVITFEVAGIDKKELKLVLNNKTLVLEIEKKKKESKNTNYVRQEFVNNFKSKRIIQLPQNIAINKIKTEHKNGILIVTIPKIKTANKNYKILKIN